MARALSLTGISIAALVIVFGLIARSRVRTERERDLLDALLLVPAGGVIGGLPIVFSIRNTSLQIAASITSMLLAIVAVVRMRRATRRPV